MSKLENWLDQKQRTVEIPARHSLYSLLFEGKLWTYPFRRFTWPLVSTSWRVLAGYWIWTKVSEDLPLFSWGELFSWIQAVYLLEFLVSVLLESARADLRKNARPRTHLLSHREKRYFAWANLVATIPLLYFGISLGWDLHYAGRYFGFYDAITLVVLFRFWISTLQRFELGLFAYGIRVRLFAWNWLIPTTALLGMYFLFREVLGPWALVWAMALEIALQTGLQILRRLKIEPGLRLPELLSRYQNMIFGIQRKVFREVQEIAQPVFRRLLFFPIFGWMHFYLISLFRSGSLAPETAVMLHVFTPLVSFTVRSGFLYWKDVVGAHGSDLFSKSIKRRLTVFSFLLSLLVFTGAFLFEDHEMRSLLLWTSVVQLSLFLTLEPWLGTELRIKHLPPFLVLGTLWLVPTPGPGFFFVGLIALFLSETLLKQTIERPFTHRAQMRRGFWAEETLARALTELAALRLAYQTRDGYLEVRVSDEKEKEIFLSWGRGWILDFTNLQELAPTGALNTPAPHDENALQFRLENLEWLSPRPAFAKGLSDEALLMRRIHFALAKGFSRGKVRLESARVKWAEAKGIVRISLKTIERF